MRLSALVIVIVYILFLSSPLIAEHSSSGGGSASSSGSTSSGASHSSFSGGSSSSGGAASSHSFGSSANSASTRSSASHVATGAASSRTLPLPSFKISPTRQNEVQEKRSARTFWHPFRKARPVRTEFHRPIRCLKQPCAICPPGGSHKGACAIARNLCGPGQSWNAIACSAQYWFHDCSDLARQLEAQRRLMRGNNDPGQSLVYRNLQDQYDQCMERFGLQPFGSFALLADMVP